MISYRIIGQDLILTLNSDSQFTCVFVELKKGVEGTHSTKTEVILNLKDAVMKTFGQDVVPKDCFVSSGDRYMITMQDTAADALIHS